MVKLSFSTMLVVATLTGCTSSENIIQLFCDKIILNFCNSIFEYILPVTGFGLEKNTG